MGCFYKSMINVYIVKYAKFKKVLIFSYIDYTACIWRLRLKGDISRVKTNNNLAGQFVTPMPGTSSRDQTMETGSRDQTMETGSSDLIPGTGSTDLTPETGSRDLTLGTGSRDKTQGRHQSAENK